MKEVRLVVLVLVIAFGVGMIYAQEGLQKPEAGYLNPYQVPLEKQQKLLDQGVWLEVDTVNGIVSVKAADSRCPQLCPCGPEGKCDKWGNECFDCAVVPTPGVLIFINEVVDTLIQRLESKQ